MKGSVKERPGRKERYHEGTGKKRTYLQKENSNRESGGDTEKITVKMEIHKPRVNESLGE